MNSRFDNPYIRHSLTPRQCSSWMSLFPLVYVINFDYCPHGDAMPSGGRISHAHIKGRGPEQGDVCIQSKYFSDEYPTRAFLHEYAHLMVGRESSDGFQDPWHGPEWYRVFNELLREYNYRPVQDMFETIRFNLLPAEERKELP